MQIEIKNYQCVYQNNDKDNGKYTYEIFWESVINSTGALKDTIKVLQDTFKDEQKRGGKPMAITIFTNEKSLKELAKEL